MWIPWTREREPDPEIDAWDRYLAGDDSPELTSLITWLERVHGAPEPEPGFITRLEDQVTVSNTEQLHIRPGLSVPPLSPPRIHSSVSPHMRWALVAAVVALLLTSLTFAALRNDRGAAPPNTVPAAALIESTPVATPEPGETLLNITYDPADIGSADPATWANHEFFVGSLESQKSFSMDSPFFNCCPGTAAFHVLTGEMTVSSPGPVEVVDDTGQSARHETITDLLLPSGGSLLISMTTPAEMRNDGEEELTFLYWGGFRSESSNMKPPGFKLGVWTQDSIGEPLSPGSLELTLTRYVLDPQQTMPMSMLGTEHFAGFVLEGRLRMMAGNHESIPAGETGVFLGTSILPANGADPITYFNSDESEATVFYVVSFESPEPA